MGLGATQQTRLVLGLPEVRLRKKYDFPTEEDDCALIRVKRTNVFGER